MTGAILPPATIGIIGGGQLGQMMALSAKEMGYRVGILDPTKDSPAGQVSDFQIVADYDDVEALNELSRRSEVLTYEFENVDRDTLSEQSDAELPQGTELLRITSNRITEKKFIRDDAKVPVTNFIEVNSPADLRKVTLPAILKTVSGGYDGHGQWSINTVQDIVNLEKDFPDTQLILEQVVDFKQELSIMVSRSQDGQIVTWPIVENIHENHILKTTTAPADISLALKNKIEAIAENIAESLELRGVLGIELFVADEEVWVNELAPRPHNSGHYSIEATNVSQFEGHIRSIVGLPIPKIELQSPATMLNLLGDELTQAREDLIHHPEWHFHDYGKLAVKPNRKMGHITVLGTENGRKLKEWVTCMSSATEYEDKTVTRRELKYQGKAKQVYFTDNPTILWVHYMDQATALNGKVHEDIPEKGRLNSAISHILFNYLTRQGIDNHFLSSISETDELDTALDILPIEVVTRNYASGHFVSKFDAKPMQKLSPIVQEFYYKSDELDDPFMNDSQILALGLATLSELTKLRAYAQEVNQALKEIFDQININLVDFKLEYGRDSEGKLILADELSPDNMRLVDQKTGQSLDKDVFRKHAGDVTVGYRDVLSRLENLEK